jgi:hypothetical protein
MNISNAGARERHKAMSEWKSGVEPLTNERFQELAEAWGRSGVLDGRCQDGAADYQAHDNDRARIGRTCA